ncbi:hypothetical protein FACS1894184_04170 [Clostridia bacterium]|nr:hypothetical protein FACS1894184_04170 [Clostridia bacterium]
MRIRWYDRILIALSGLLLLALGLGLIMTGLREPKVIADFGIKILQVPFGFALAQSIRAGTWYVLAVLIASGLALALWGIRQWISLIPKRKHETFFAATELDRGTLTIARAALEHLVQKCVSEHPEMTVSKINIDSENDKATVRLRATIRSGVSMPKVTAALKKEIIEYMSECAGIAVSNVQVVIEDTTPPLMLPPASIIPPVIAEPVREITPEPSTQSEPEPVAIPIPLGAFVDGEPAIPVMASISFPGDNKSVAFDSHEADENDSDVESISTSYSSSTIEAPLDQQFDPAPDMSERIDYNSINGEEDGGESERGDIHAV